MKQFQNQEERVNGRWTQLQHSMFLQGLEMYGKNWKKIEELVKTRTGSQIRSHAQKYFLKFKKEPSINGNSSEESHVSSCAKPLTVNLKEEIEEGEYNQNLSFFMNMIVKKAADSQTLNFWEEFIDYGQSRAQNNIQGSTIRKNSFVTIQGAQDEKQQSPLSCQGQPQSLPL